MVWRNTNVTWNTFCRRLVLRHKRPACSSRTTNWWRVSSLSISIRWYQPEKCPVFTRLRSLNRFWHKSKTKWPISSSVGPCLSSSYQGLRSTSPLCILLIISIPSSSRIAPTTHRYSISAPFCGMKVLVKNLSLRLRAKSSHLWYNSLARVLMRSSIALFTYTI